MTKSEKDESKTSKKLKATKDKVAKDIAKKTKKLEEKFNKDLVEPAKKLKKKVADKVEKAKRTARSKRQETSETESKELKKVKKTSKKDQESKQKEEQEVLTPEQQLIANIESSQKFEEQNRLRLQEEENARSMERHRLDEEERARLNSIVAPQIKPLSEMVIEKPAVTEMKYNVDDKVKFVETATPELPGIKDQEGTIISLTENGEYEVQFYLGQGSFITKIIKQDDLDKK